MFKKSSAPEKPLRQRALEYLGKREYSYKELGQKLKSYLDENEDADSITAILDDFKTRGWLSDARFTEQMVHARRAKFGSSKIVHELREKGIESTLIEGAIEQLKETELASAKEIWQKKYKNAPANRDEWAKQARFLQSRGFGFDTIKKVLNLQTDDD
ncbi:recombination regulator RecX [Methylotenera versatilis]|uniref:recombination regulator RecX n=1 Tax=Methylotenera versatilis TaxID=1055487 RepID=UPI000647ABC5|nr:recombination regulator RecX [Methylotenera versatilis]